MSSTNTNKPWLDKEGNFLEDKDIKKISKNWDQETWDAYLYASGTEKPMSSYESTYATFSELLEKTIKTPEGPSSPDIDLSPYVKKLKKDERILLHLLFWSDCPLSEASFAIGKTYYKTEKLKLKALKELQGALEGHSQVMEGRHEAK